MTLPPKLFLPHLPQAILFDYDGVLVCSEPVHLLAWKQLLSELKLPIDLELLQEKTGKPSPQILLELLDHYLPDRKDHDYPIPQLIEKKNTYYLDYAQRKLHLYPGVYEGMQWLKAQKIKITVVSNSIRSELERALHHFQIHAFINSIVSRTDVPSPKPNPAPYLLSLSQLNLPAAHCLAVEDSPTGLQAALLAHLPVAALLTNFPKKHLTHPVPGRPELQPTWIGADVQTLISQLQLLY